MTSSGASPAFPDNPSLDPVFLAKQNLRRSAREKRRLMSSQDRETCSLAICDRILRLDAFRAARSVMVYLADSQEPDLAALIASAQVQGKVVAAPRMDWKGRVIHPCRLQNPSADVVPARHGLTEPAPHCSPVPLGEIDLVLVPGVGFDSSGNRLGRGGGFYDRFLALGELRALRAGVAFDDQIVPEIPAQPHDAPMDLVVTESRTIQPAQRRHPG